MRSACPAQRKAAGTFAAIEGSLVVEDWFQGGISASAFDGDRSVATPRVRIERRHGEEVKGLAKTGFEP